MKNFCRLLLSVLLFGCTAAPVQETPLRPLESAGTPVLSGLSQGRLGEDAETVQAFFLYQTVGRAVKEEDDLTVQGFLAAQNDFFAQKIRGEWLKSLGRRGEWQMFAAQYPLLPEDMRTQELRCYDALREISTVKTVSPLARELSRSAEVLPESCNLLIQAAAFSGSLNAENIRLRIAVLLGYNRITLARSLAEISAQEDTYSRLSALVTPSARNRADILARFAGLSGSLNAQEYALAAGILAMSFAKDLDMPRALHFYAQADTAALNEEQWEWYARAALRAQQWTLLGQVIAQMPDKLQNRPVWQYWRGRALEAGGGDGTPFLRSAAHSGRNFYALLAQEKLGMALNTASHAAPDAAHIRQVAADPLIAQSLQLYRYSDLYAEREMRTAAQQLWRHAVQNYNDAALTAAAALAHEQGFYEMSIYSADKSDSILLFELRYPAPFRNETEYYARLAGLDPAWVYGLIRQESRFMTAAKSRVGAGGLMQIMPATARLIARKTGMENYNVNQLDDNLRMGTWYLADTLDKLGSEMLATAGYNAGPARPARWLADVPLEGAVYAETIPFNETRDYVQKVMANTVYYSRLFGNRRVTLGAKLGTVPAR